MKKHEREKIYTPLIEMIMRDLGEEYSEYPVEGSVDGHKVYKQIKWSKNALMAVVYSDYVSDCDPDFLKLITPAIKRWEKATGDEVHVFFEDEYVHIE